MQKQVDASSYTTSRGTTPVSFFMVDEIRVCARWRPASAGDVAEPMSGLACLALATAEADILAIETREISSCLHCGGSALHKWGTGRKAVRRWRCCDCRRSFSATTGTVVAGLHAPRKLASVITDMMSDEPSSCRRLAERLSVCRMTAWAWRQRLNTALAAILRSGVEVRDADVAEKSRVVVRESRKASREWVDHRRDPITHAKPDRQRWIDYRLRRLPLPNPMSPYLIPVVFLEDRSGDQCAAVASHVSETLAIDKVAIARTLPDTESTVLAGASGRAFGIVPRGSGESRAVELTEDNTAGSVDGDEPADRWARFLRPFRGPAAKYLVGYVAWFIARFAASDDHHMRDLLRGVWLGPRPLAGCSGMHVA